MHKQVHTIQAKLSRKVAFLTQQVAYKEFPLSVHILQSSDQNHRKKNQRCVRQEAEIQAGRLFDGKAHVQIILPPYRPSLKSASNAATPSL